MNKKIDSIKHKDNRAHIPSKEEAGYEDANAKVSEGRETLELPKNPVVHRGQDPELYWMNKYGNDDRDDLLKVDIRSLYRYEHIAPEQLISGLYKTVVEKRDENQEDIFSTNELFGNALDRDELEKVSEYYQHSDGWTNRLIQGDSHLVMASLLEREGMAGQIQSIYIDPPYGINYSSNWQIKLSNKNVGSADKDVTGEPEMVKAYRDTWELGIHSYLTYLRDRLLVAKELLNQSGSCFIQISNQNVHLVRSLMDEVFGSENFVNQIIYRTKNMTIDTKLLGSVNDVIIWYAKDKENVKYRKLYKYTSAEGDSHYNIYETPDGELHKMTSEQIYNHSLLPKGADPCQLISLYPIGYSESRDFEVEFKGKTYRPASGRSWKFDRDGYEVLVKSGRIRPYTDGKTLRYLYKLSDYPVSPLHSLWHDTAPTSKKEYVVQTSNTPIQRCILMTTDPGDLVLDPTCGSGTTAFVAELWGRRWLTIDTSRIALNIAKVRLATAIYPYYRLYDSNYKDIRQGFSYKSAQHITLESITTGEHSNDVILYDEPATDNSKIRVSGPFTVETLQNYEPLNPENLDNGTQKSEDDGTFINRIYEHLKSAGVKNGIKNEMAVFIRVDELADSFLHAEGFYLDSNGKEKKAYFHIGPKFGTVAKQAVNEAVKSCRQRGDADWLIVLGFSFESDISNQNVTMSVGSFEVTKVRMHDDLMQDGLLKKDKKAASFVTIGEPDIKLHKDGDTAHVEVCGLDIYDPIKDIVKARNIEDIAYWTVDDDYDGSNYVVKQVFFCGGKKDEFKKWRKGLDNLAKSKTKKKVEQTLKIEIDDEAFDRLYGFKSHSFKIQKDQKVAVRVVSQFGEESTKVLSV
ncbi:MAG: site-specific DNA-methyltransferase [Candidatus Marinimicrobia bacterium]|nr:site-specific DNA-methyltransferase [Candidatus Neomarinimicrobiota bacterium]MBT7899334.1 site-specific DNA-methyltransferase [Candidatus Neomarinimicrobiota bacterium]